MWLHIELITVNRIPERIILRDDRQIVLLYKCRKNI